MFSALILGVFLFTLTPFAIKTRTHAREYDYVSSRSNPRLLVLLVK